MPLLSWVFPVHCVWMLVLQPTIWLGFSDDLSPAPPVNSTAVLGLPWVISLILLPPCYALRQKRGDNRSEGAGSALQEIKIYSSCSEK